MANRRSKIETLGLTEDVQVLVSSGLSARRITARLNNEHPEAEISESAVTRYVARVRKEAAGEARVAGDIMLKNYRTLYADARVVSSEMPTLVVSGDAIVGVIPPHASGSSARALAVDQYIMTPEKNPINDLLREMDRTGSRFALVMGTLENTRPH